MLKLKSNIKHDGRMDKDVIELCEAINALPALQTIESCSGHGRTPFSIFFKCDGTSMEGLFFLTRCIDRRYFQHGHLWSINLSVGDTVRNNILPTLFDLQSINLWSEEKIKGKKAYKQAGDLVENMNYHLNHKNFIKGFNLNLDKFGTEIITEEIPVMENQ